MRLRFGVAMAPKGGRTAIVGAEVREGRARDGRLVHEYLVGHVERVTGTSVEAAAARAAELMAAFADVRPCLLVDTGTAQGTALRAALRGTYPDSLHRPHAYPGTGDRKDLFAAFLQAYAAGRVRFLPGLPDRADLDKALVFYLGAGVGKDGVELSSEDEALVIALGLALYWPRHGPKADQAAAPDAKRPPAPPEG